MENKEEIHLCLCWFDSDGSYSKFPATTIVSILENNKTNKLRFHLITPDISGENRQKIKKIIKDYQQEVVFYEKLNAKSLRILNLIKENDQSTFGQGAYLRLLIPELISKRIKKVLYLDSDLIISGNLKELWNMNLSSAYVLGANHENHPKIKEWGIKQYINSGVLLMNLERIREINLLKELQKVYSAHKNDFYFVGMNSCADQDLINLVFRENIGLINQKYNFAIRKGRFVHGKIIYHYGVLFKPFRFKPCFVDKKYKELYWKYFDKTPWRGWRPGWDLKKAFKTTSTYFLLVRTIKKFGLEKPLKKLLNKKKTKRI